MAGLQLVGFNEKRIKRTRYKKTLSRFRAHFGSSPASVAQIIHELSSLGIVEECKIHSVWLLVALNWMRLYRTEEQMEGPFDTDAKTLRKHIWFYIRSIHNNNSRDGWLGCGETLEG